MTIKLPPPDTHCEDFDTGLQVWSYSKGLVEQIIADQSREIAALKEQVEGLGVKAARYDWLRDDADHMRVKKGSPQVCLTDEWGCLVGIGQWVYPRGTELDDAIAAAISAKGGSDASA